MTQEGTPHKVDRAEGVIIRRQADNVVEEMSWGRLIWRASAALGNSELMTVGECIIRPGEANGRHFHPNCEEILHVAAGRICHSAGELHMEMGPGDTICIPAGTVHNARNLGDTEARLLITFSSAFRESVGAE